MTDGWFAHLVLLGVATRYRTKSSPHPLEKPRTRTAAGRASVSCSQIIAVTAGVSRREPWRLASAESDGTGLDRRGTGESCSAERE
jgi:hypothetical protein